MSIAKRMSRRRFLRRAAGTTAGVVGFPFVVPASALGQGGRTTAGDRITIGFIGSGKQSKHLMRSFLNCPGTQVVASCDVDKLKLVRGKGIVEGHYAGKRRDSF